MATVPAQAPVHLLVILFAGVALLCALPYVARYSLPLVFGDVHHNAPMRSLREALGGDASPGLRWATAGIGEFHERDSLLRIWPCPTLPTLFTLPRYRYLDATYNISWVAPFPSLLSSRRLWRGDWGGGAP